MKNKKIPLLAIGMLLVGAGASIAYQSHAAQIAQPTPVQTIVNVSDQTVDQKDANGKDLETADDTTSVDQKDASGKDLETADDATSVSGGSKESANDTDSSTQSEQNETGSGQAEVAGE